MIIAATSLCIVRGGLQEQLCTRMKYARESKNIHLYYPLEHVWLQAGF